MKFFIIITIFIAIGIMYLPLLILHPSSSVTNVIFIGNPGVGKSTICNSFNAGFKSGINIGYGMTHEVQFSNITIINNKKYIFIDSPGLLESNDKNIKNAEEIKKGFEKGGNYTIIFVITLEAGRLKYFDIEMIKRVTNSFIILENQTGLIINKINKEEFKILNDINKFLELYEYFKILHIPIKQENILFIPEFKKNILYNIKSNIINNNLFNKLIPNTINANNNIDVSVIPDKCFPPILSPVVPSIPLPQVPPIPLPQVPPIPAPPLSNMIVGCQVSFRTNDDDKDRDTLFTVIIYDNTNKEIARISYTGGKFPDHSNRGPFHLQLINKSDKSAFTNSRVNVNIKPRGNDTWKFNMIIELKFENGEKIIQNYNGLVLSQRHRSKDFIIN